MQGNTKQTNISSGVFRTLSIILVERFAKIVSSYFWKTLHLRSLTGFWICPGCRLFLSVYRCFWEKAKIVNKKIQRKKKTERKKKKKGDKINALTKWIFKNTNNANVNKFSFECLILWTKFNGHETVGSTLKSVRPKLIFM